MFSVKKVTNKILISCVLVCSVHLAYSQVGVETTTPDESSILDVYSTDKGMYDWFMKKKRIEGRRCYGNIENGRRHWP